MAGWVGYSFRPAAVPDSVSVQELARYRQIKERFEKIGQVDIEEYLKLKNEKARFEKADEIMGKILMLMLYDMGLRGSEAQLGKLKSRVVDRAAAPDLNAPSSGSPGGAPAVSPDENRTSNSGKKTAVGSAEKPPANTDRRDQFAKIKDIDRADQIDDFLKSAEIPDFFGALRGGTPLSEAQLEQLNGTFAGRAVFDDPKLVPWDVQMYFNAQMQNGEIFGEFDVQLKKNGKQFSRTRSGRKRGQKPIKLDHFMGLEGDGQSLIINAQGDDGYFQLYYFPRLTEFHGLVYLKKSLGVFERRGVVQLRR